MVSSADLKPQICHQNDNISIKMIKCCLKTLVGYYLSQLINQNVCHNYFAGLTKRFHNLWYLGTDPKSQICCHQSDNIR